MNSAAFVRINQKTLGYIKKVEPYITYGLVRMKKKYFIIFDKILFISSLIYFFFFISYPSRQLISDLIYKKGFAKVDGKRTAINNNEIVENNFGEKGLVCGL